MPNGSSGPGPPPPPPPPPSTSTTPHKTSTTTTDHIPSASPPRKFLLSGPKRTVSVDNVSMKAKIFGGNPPASPTTPRPRTGHQTIRGRISGPMPMPMPNPLDDDEFPMRNPGTGIASSTPIEHDLAIQRQLQQQQQQPFSKPSSPVTPGFAPQVAQPFPLAAGVEVPQTVLEHPSTPTHQPSSSGTGTGTGTGGGPSPEGGASSVSATRTSTTAKGHRANQSSSARYSAVSANSQKTGTSNNNASADGSAQPPQRKKSTLRSAIGKLLRRKKNQGSLSSVSEIDRQAAIGGPQHQPQHRSVPPASRDIPTQHLVPRVTSMPISEFDRALRSHSIGPDDITAIESARNSMDVLGSSPNRKRAATIINTRIPPAGFIPRSRGEEWAGLSPRPASTHGRGSRLTEEDPDAIGRAITSDGSDIGHKRRSRSLSQLNEVAFEQAGRRRSDEIRYWRESYDVPGPLSPLSSVPNETEPETNEDNYELGGGGRVSMGAPESAHDRIPKTPPQPFHFGSVASMNEMAGMKITQAVTLEERFGNLEVRMIKLERVVDQLCHSVPGFKGPFTEPGVPSGASQRSGAATGGLTRSVSVSKPQYAYSNAAPPMIPAIYQTASAGPSRDGFESSSHMTNPSRRSVETTTDDNLSSHMSTFGDNHTYMDSLHPPSSSATQAVSTVASSVPPVPVLLRPNSETTVRPTASMPSLGSQQGSASGGEDNRDRSSNTAALLVQLDQERAQRHLLEDQVRKLSDRMNNLSTTMFAMVRDPAKSRSNERLRPQTAHSNMGMSGGGGGGGSAASPMMPPPSAISINTRPAIAPSSKAQSIFGKEFVPTGALNSLASSPAKEAADDDAFSDAFQTPREEPTPGGMTYSQAFGDDFGGAGYVGSEQTGSEPGEDLEERKKAARTLSLSQLTMGKGVPTRI